MVKKAIIGGIPHPIGGVTTFILRLVSQEKKIVDEIIDLYPDKNKMNVPDDIKHSISPKGHLRFVWLFFKLLFRNYNLLHFNFSTSRSLQILKYLPKKKSRWILTLHNGKPFPEKSDQAKCEGSLKKVDEILVLSESQKEDYVELGVNLEKLTRVSSYIRPVNFNTDKSITYFNSFFDKFSKVVFISGYPTKIYRHDWAIKLAKEFQDIGFCFCLYGSDSDSLKSNLETEIGNLDNGLLTGVLSAVAFQQVLAQSHIYLRPNSVDSFGIVVADAINLGVLTLASNVCDRFEGAHLFESDSFGDFRNKFIELSKKEKPLNLPEPSDDFKRYETIYQNPIR
jgi:hypothetical protein